jgi:thymidylate synthase
MLQYQQLVAKILKEGVTIYGSRPYKELINQQITVNGTNFYSVSAIRDIKTLSKYLKGELCWYFSGNRYIDGIGKYSKFWKDIANKDETANSNYGYLVFYRKKYEYTNYEWCLQSLKNDMTTRQAVMLYPSKEFYYKGNKDFVCTQTQQFFIRNWQLHCIVTIRSSDMIYGLTYDIPWWSIVQQHLVKDLQYNYPTLVCGPLHINIGSAHVYTHQLSLAAGIAGNDFDSHYVKLLKQIPLDKNQEWFEAHIDEFIEIK